MKMRKIAAILGILIDAARVCFMHARRDFGLLGDSGAMELS
jgi:hypothetical protein